MGFTRMARSEGVEFCRVQSGIMPLRPVKGFGIIPLSDEK